MKLKDNVKMTGIGIFDGKLSLIISERTGFMWFVEIFKDKKGSYIKFNSKYIDSTEKKRGRKIYIKDDLWWAVNRFENYLNGYEKEDEN